MRRIKQIISPTLFALILIFPLALGQASISTVLEMTNGTADLGEADDQLLVAEPRHVREIMSTAVFRKAKFILPLGILRGKSHFKTSTPIMCYFIPLSALT